MDNDKRSKVKVEVPRAKPKFKDVVNEALPEVGWALLDAGLRKLSDVVTRRVNDRNIELNIDIPRIQLREEPVDNEVFDVVDWTDEENNIKELE